MEGPDRPLSPFLIYRWGVTNTLSILHRITGLCLSLGLLILSCWLIAIATGPEAYASVIGWYGSAWFKLPLAIVILCFFYHLGNGIRHLVWDAGYGFGKPTIAAGGWTVVVFAIVATAGYVVLALF